MIESSVVTSDGDPSTDAPDAYWTEYSDDPDITPTYSAVVSTDNCDFDPGGDGTVDFTIDYASGGYWYYLADSGAFDAANDSSSSPWSDGTIYEPGFYAYDVTAVDPTSSYWNDTCSYDSGSWDPSYAYCSQFEIYDNEEPPANTGAPTIGGTPAFGQPLYITSNGDWTNSPDIFSYQWYQCDPDYPYTCSAISGETYSSIYPGEAQIGYEIEVAVTAYNANPDPSSPATSSASGTVAPPTCGSLDSQLIGTQTDNYISLTHVTGASAWVDQYNPLECVDYVGDDEDLTSGASGVAAWSMIDNVDFDPVELAQVGWAAQSYWSTSYVYFFYEYGLVDGSGLRPPEWFGFVSDPNDLTPDKFTVTEDTSGYAHFRVNNVSVAPTPLLDWTPVDAQWFGEVHADQDQVPGDTTNPVEFSSMRYRSDGSWTDDDAGDGYGNYTDDGDGYATGDSMFMWDGYLMENVRANFAKRSHVSDPTGRRVLCVTEKQATDGSGHVLFGAGGLQSCSR